MWIETGYVDARGTNINSVGRDQTTVHNVSITVNVSVHVTTRAIVYATVACCVFVLWKSVYFLFGSTALILINS